ncbi:MAG: hypothetical protein DHS20C01_08770 [marine bacterium B5-7]|nr:MAG: hypothetical protein DHS20C01_08770 [marine bacterium B5-7]
MCVLGEVHARVTNRIRQVDRWWIFLLTVLSQSVSAQSIVLDEDMSEDEKSSGWLPYVFSTDSYDTAIGIGGGFSGIGDQRQAGLIGTVMGTTNDSFLASGALTNYRFPGTGRLFLDAFFFAGHFTDDRVYADMDHNPAQQRAGSNDSDPDDFLSGITNDFRFELTFDYRVPIGSARQHPVPVYRLNRGLLTSGPEAGNNWNPLTSGTTNASLTWFNRYRDIDDDVNDPDNDVLFYKTSGLKLNLDYDNTDFPRNPSRGSRQQIILARDFGWFNSSNTWSNVQLDSSKYFNFGSSDAIRQRVLALNFWTSYSPTWATDPDASQVVNHRPPAYLGSTLGGYDRMRAYPSGRFSDQAAVYYSAELRIIPDWNPLKDLPILDYFEIDWIQFVSFLEMGRVGSSYDTDLFIEDLKYDVGLGIRMMAFRNVVRLDLAYGEEGTSLWAMYAQPFAR